MKEGYEAVYVGDGFSDLHASKSADIVFAKDTLLKHCKKEGVECLPFKDFKDVYGYFKDIR